MPEEQRLAWVADRSGILIGRGLADLTGWKVGEAVPLRSAIWRTVDGSDTWDVTVRAIYDLPQGGDTRQILLHQEYFEEARGQAKGLIGWYLVKVSDVDRAAAISKQIDTQFSNSPAETKTSSERAMAQSFVNQVGNIGAILRAIVTAVFFTMLLVTANTMAQSVRERTNEIGVLKTLGYTNGGVLGLVLAEAVLITVIGGTLGLAGAWWLGVQFEPVFRQYLPGFRVPADAIVLGAVFMVHSGSSRAPCRRRRRCACASPKRCGASEARVTAWLRQIAAVTAMNLRNLPRGSARRWSRWSASAGSWPCWCRCCRWARDSARPWNCRGATMSRWCCAAAPPTNSRVRSGATRSA